jgi:hypothetical protein
MEKPIDEQSRDTSVAKKNTSPPDVSLMTSFHNVEPIDEEP